jgi:outer membrane lipoprotein-sorting protein
VKLFRTLPTSRLVALGVAVALAAVIGVFAVSAIGGSGATPPPKPLAQAIHDALGGAKPTGITAHIGFTNTLFPSGSIVGQAASALMSSATGRLWTNEHGGRLELQSDAGDAQIVWSDTKVTVYDASSNTAYVIDLPKESAGKDGGAHQVPSVDEIAKFLTDLGKQWSISGADPTNTGGQESYTVRVSPSHDGGLLGSAELAFDALRGVPLKIAVYAQGASSPVLALEATNVTYGTVPDSDVQVPPPAGAKIVDLSSQAQGAHGNGGHDTSAPAVTGRDAVAKAAPFTVVAPDKLVGLPQQDIRLVGGKTAVAVYGQGLGAIVLVERAKDTTGGNGGSPLAQLPAVTLDGVTAHELATQLGTVLTWDRSGVTYVLAGSLPPAAAEAAARTLE